MAELKCKDGTVIKISDETEAELRKAFRQEIPNYVDDYLKVRIRIWSDVWPIGISVDGEEVSRDVEGTKAYIEALQEAVKYCEENNLGD